MKPKKILAVAGTTYQLIVLHFIKDAFFKDAQIDLVVSDKTPLLEKLYNNKKLEPYYHKVYFADARKLKKVSKPAPVTLFESFVYNKCCKQILSAPLDVYDEVFYACPEMPDEIIKEISKTVIKKNPNVKFNRYEDGFASYTRFSGHIISSPSGVFLYKKVLGFDLEKQENNLYLFEPALASAHITWNKIHIPKTNLHVFDELQQIFDYEPIIFSEKFVFLGQGTANGIDNASTYQSLVNMIINIVGFENIIVKKHPRGVHDNFSKHVHTLESECPWELFELSDAMHDKVLISYYSTACMTGKLLFHTNSKVLFLYPLAADSFSENIDFEFYFELAVKKFPQITIVRTAEELTAYLLEQMNTVTS